MGSSLLRSEAIFFYSQKFSILELVGRDAKSFLQNLITNDLRLLAKQSVIRTIITNTSGKIVFDVFIKKIVAGFQFFVTPSELQALREHLEFFHILEDLQIYEKEQISLFYILFCDTQNKQKYLFPANLKTEVIDEGANYFLLAATKKDYFLQQGWQELSAEDFEKTRAFFAIIKNSIDFDKKRLPQEAGFRRLINFKKGCFVGQEAIARLEHKGRLVRILSQLICQKPLSKSQKLTNGKQILGSVTSECPYNYCGNYYAFGYLKTQSLLAKEAIYLDKQNILLKAIPLEKLKQ